MIAPSNLPWPDTARMCLRPLIAEDEAFFCRLYGDAATMRFIGPALSREQAASGFRRILAQRPGVSGQPLYLAMVEKTRRQPLGLCGTPQWQPDAHSLEAGILLLPEARSRGFAREGMTAWLRWLYENTAVDEVRVRFSAECPAVRRLNESLGFGPCGAAVEANGSRPGSLVWSMERSAWMAKDRKGERQ